MSQGPATVVASPGGVGRKSGLATGIALQGTVGRTTSLAAPAASSVAQSRTSPPAASTAMHSVPEVVFHLADALGGNLVTGFAPGRGAMNTTSQAEWNATDAMHLGPLQHRLAFLGSPILRRKPVKTT
ncbi:hypothetical protein MRB53_011915 [Persea americana]|uniref:Uncharacterized protein n=1 Tax=Persea americana TaxID=3435 RepID=A0ACC2LWQ4_PERAE|nr:hypothetical protein MRB53_011915 [Persea americana]